MFETKLQYQLKLNSIQTHEILLMIQNHCLEYTFRIIIHCFILYILYVYEKRSNKSITYTKYNKQKNIQVKLYHNVTLINASILPGIQKLYNNRIRMYIHNGRCTCTTTIMGAKVNICKTQSIRSHCIKGVNWFSHAQLIQ